MATITKLVQDPANAHPKRCCMCMDMVRNNFYMDRGGCRYHIYCYRHWSKAFIEFTLAPADTVETCAICTELMPSGYALRCGHRFHRRCALKRCAVTLDGSDRGPNPPPRSDNKFAETTCPMCRAELFP